MSELREALRELIDFAEEYKADASMIADAKAALSALEAPQPVGEREAPGIDHNIHWTPAGIVELCAQEVSGYCNEHGDDAGDRLRLYKYQLAAAPSAPQTHPPESTQPKEAMP